MLFHSRRVLAGTFLLVFSAFGLALSGCGGASSSGSGAGSGPAPAPVNPPSEDGSVIHGVATVTVSAGQDAESGLLVPQIANDASVVVTYNNAADTNYVVNTSNLKAGALTGTTLSLGSFSVSSLTDNNLAVCGTNGSTQCSGAVIRVYTTGSVAGFVNTAGQYGAPVYAGTLNPSTAVGLNEAGAVIVGQYAIPSGTHVLSLASAFPTTNYAVTSDFSNAGAGSYSMTFVMEYALTP